MTEMLTYVKLERQVYNQRRYSMVLTHRYGELHRHNHTRNKGERTKTMRSMTTMNVLIP